MTLSRATQIEEPYRCPTCKGTGEVTMGPACDGCSCGGRLHGFDVAECPDCYGGAIPCESCFDHPAKHTHRYEFAWKWTTELLCDGCMARIENGPSDSDGEAWWYETHHETDYQAEKARRETR